MLVVLALQDAVMEEHMVVVVAVAVMAVVVVVDQLGIHTWSYSSRKSRMVAQPLSSVVSVQLAT